MSAALNVALSLTQTVERIGSYAGLAATVALGVLTLLYFAQAREVKRLREWAGQAPERAAEIAQRGQVDVQRRVIAQPQTPAAAAQASGAPTDAPEPTVGLTGDAAKAAAAAAIVAARATHPPAVGPPGQLARPAVAPAGAPGGPAAAPNPASAALPKAPGGAGAPTGGVAAGPGAPAAGDAPAAPTPAPGATSPVTPPGKPVPTPPGKPVPTPAGTSAAAPPASAPAKPRVVAQPPVVGRWPNGTPLVTGPAPTPPPSGDGERRSSGQIAAIIGGGLACVLVVGLVITLVGGDDPAPKKPNEIGTVPAAEVGAGSSSSTRAQPPVNRVAQPPINRGATTTTVLNGTTTSGLARNVATKLESAGFTIAEVDNNVDQTLSGTIVYYSGANKRAAGVVARIVGVPERALQPVDRNADVAGSGARVVVAVGADLIE